jgi:hypothetical protein
MLGVVKKTLIEQHILKSPSILFTCVPRVSKYVDEIFHFDWMKIMGQGFVTSMAFWLFHSDWMKIMGQGFVTSMAFWLFHSDWMKIMGQGFVTSMAFWLFHSDWMKIMDQGLLQAWPFGYSIWIG